MSLSIITNSPSLTAQQSLERAQNGLEASMKKLSTGYKINSAKDDAAGLQISNRMTSQVNGLSVAIRNANDGISVSQTAEGAMAETTSILHRIRDLSLQSANASNDAQDRIALQREVSQLQSEIDRIAETTTFNSLKVLDGSYTNKNFQVGANAYETIAVTIGDMSASVIGGVDKTLDVITSGSEFGTVTRGGDGQLSTTGTLDIATRQGKAAIEIEANDSARTIASKINAERKATGVTATASTEVALDGFTAFDVTINGVSFTGVADLAALETKVNSDATLKAMGITASDSGKKLTSANGDTITFADVSAGGIFGGKTLAAKESAYAMGTYIMSAEDPITLSGTAATGSNVAGGVMGTIASNGTQFGKVAAAAADAPTTGIGAVVGDVDITGPVGTASISITADDSAAEVAVKVNAKTTETGVSATAKTEVEISGLTLTGAETATIKVNGTVTGAGASNLDELATEINKLNLSNVTATYDGTSKLTLTDSTGANIELADFVSSAGGAAALQVGGVSLSGATGSTTDSTTVVGTFELQANGDISLAETGGGTAGGLANFAGATSTNTPDSKSFTSGSDFGICQSGLPIASRTLTGIGSMIIKGPTGSDSVTIGVTDSAASITENINNRSGTTGVVAKAFTEANITDINIGSGKNGIAPTEMSVTINGVEMTMTDPRQFSDMVNTNPRLQHAGISSRLNDDGSVTLRSDTGLDIEISDFRADVSNDESVKVNGMLLDASHNSAVVAGAFELQSDGPITLSGPAVDGGSTNMATSRSQVETRNLHVSDIDITTEAGAQQAVAIIDDAIADIDSQRGTLGAVQNRLEHTIFNLQSIRENVTNSRSRIKDTDYAAEMAEMTKQQILKQASIANLAQANEMARDVLMLIR